MPASKARAPEQRDSEARERRRLRQRGAPRGAALAIALTMTSLGGTPGALAASSDSAAAHAPLPEIWRKRPEDARALFEWFAAVWGEEMSGAKACPRNAFLYMARAFPRTEAVDAVFVEYGWSGGLWDAVAVDRFGTLEDRLRLLDSTLRCVREYAIGSIGYELKTLADAEGRDAGAETAVALRAAISEQGTSPAVTAGSATPRLWRDFALVPAHRESSDYEVILVSKVDGWRVLGTLFTGISCGVGKVAPFEETVSASELP